MEREEMHRRLATETAEKEQVKLEMYNLKQTVEMYRRKMVVLVDDPANAARLKDLVRQFHLELKDKLQVEGVGGQLDLQLATASPARTYEVLRRSLQEAQRRCDTLNSDMLRQTEANDELLQTLNTVKDANRRLLDQIRQQTEEIQMLTQQRILDEEDAENSRWRHQAEVEKMRQDHMRELLNLKERADERFEQANAYYQDKLRHVQSRIEIAKADLTQCKQSQFEQRQEMKMVGESMYQQVRAGEKDILAAWDSAAKRHSQEKATLSDFLHELEVKLATEKELRQSETSHLNYQKTCLQAEKEDLSARTTRDIGQLSSQISDLDRTLTAERQAWAQERSRLEQQIEDLVRQSQNTDAMLEAANRENIRVESSMVQCEAEVSAKDMTIQDMRRQIRESDDALGCAVRGNEHLREQMEEQMQRYQEMNAKDLQQAQAMYEEKARAEKGKKEAEISQLQRHLRQVEEQHSNKAAEVERVKQIYDGLEMEKSSTSRDLEMWKKQYSAATEMRQELERELAESRQDWGKDKLRLQESVDDAMQARAVLETDLSATTEAYHEFKRQAQQWEADATSRIYMLEDNVRGREQQVNEYMTHLVEQTDNMSKLKAEYAANSAKSNERIQRVEGDLEQSANEKNDLAKRLQHAIETERRELQESKEQYERWRDAHVYSLKQVQDEGLQKVADLQRERHQVEEKYRSELTEEKRALETGKRNAAALDTEVVNLRKQLSKSTQECNMHKNQYDKAHRELEQVRQAAQMEVKALSSQVSDLRHSETRLTSELKDESRQRGLEKERHNKALEDVKTQSVTQAIDMDSKIRGMKHEFESTLSLTESRYKDVVTREKAHMGSIQTENDKLRQASRYGVPGGSHLTPAQALTSTLESHVSRFQHKVDEIRADLATGIQSRYGADPRSATPRSLSPNRSGLAGASPHREFGGLGLGGLGSYTSSRGGLTPGYSPAKNVVGASRFGSSARQ